MPRLKTYRSCSGSRDGIALLAVLACVLLLTILTVSYISFMKLNRISSVEYSTSVQAQEIAQGGMQDILQDLHQEIVAGSKISTSAGNANIFTYTNNGPAIYVPTTNFTVMPARLGYTNSGITTVWNTNGIATTALFSPSLVRVSRRAATAGATTFNPAAPFNNSALYTASALPLNRASAASTLTSSVNGRAISAARWNKTFLLATNAAGVPTPFSTAVANTSTVANGPPDWVYVTRAGSRVCQTSELATLKQSSNVTTPYTYTAGSNPPASPVVGRYAFVMYDEGALLDANVAGSPSTLINQSTNVVSSGVAPVSTTDPTTGRTLTFSGKSYLASADLMQLPGFANASSPTAAQNTIDNLIIARNASVASGSVPGGSNYLTSLFQYASFGFTSFQTTGTHSDSPFLSRQDLINYFASIDPAINTSSATYSQALPYLGTFSRAVNAPTYAPPFDSANIPNYVSGLGTPVTYNTSAETGGIANRDLANVRFPSSITAGTLINHYTDDGTVAPVTYTVNPGDQLLQCRFSLAKINWLSQADPTTGNGPGGNYPTAIQACFGLSWGTVGPVANGGNACWKYIGSKNNFNGTIETLDQVAAEGREPNFFEILKAAILSGSLGLNPGPTAWSNGTGVNPFGGTQTAFSFKDFGNYAGGPESLDIYSFDRSTTPTITAPARIPDVQIIKIGANIIDQYDTDSYPTAIYFPYTALQGTIYDAAKFKTRANGGTGDINGPSDMVFGDENLPYLQGVYQFAATDTASDNTPLEAWWQPVLWNPHQQPSSTNLTSAQTSSIPSTFSIRAYGTSWVYWLQNYGSPPPTPTPPGTGNTTPITLDNDFINFKDTAPTTSVFYANPIPLTTSASGLSGVTASTSTDAAFMTPSSSIKNYAQNPFIGFFMGSDSNYQASVRPGPPPIVDEAQCRAQTTSGVTFVLGWTDSSGNFHPYSYIQQDVGYSYSVLGQEKGDDEHGSVAGAPGQIGDAEFHLLLDPRTFRFGNAAGWGWTWLNSTIYPSQGSYATATDNFGQGRPVIGNFVYSTPSSSSYFVSAWAANSISAMPQTGLKATYYADPDGVVRPADAFYANAYQTSYTGDGLMLLVSAASPSGSPIAAGDSSGNVQHGRRPVILNRPFRSLGELGYVFRDLPFKTLDLNSGSSADAALLDVFSLADESKISNSQVNTVLAGQVSLNNASLPVIQALLAGGSKKDLDPTYNLGSETPTTSPSHLALAASITVNLNTPLGTAAASALNSLYGPLNSRADLVTRLGPAIQSTKSTGTPPVTILSVTSSFGNKQDQSNKSYLEAPVRALADNVNTRTWNLLIDVIAQSGQLASTATSLDNFVVQGEKRYWLHVAIDRYTGKVVAQQLEPVYE